MYKILSFEEFNESNNQIVKYRWREAHNDIWHETRCEVLSSNDKTATIKLLGYGKNGRPPGSELRVLLKSLIGFDNPNKPQKPEPDLSWQKYTYFD